MDNGTLKEFLKVKKMSFTKEEIEDIMNSELEKDPEEMDTELIDMCLDILTEEPKEKTDEEITDSSARSDKKVKKLNLKKGLLVAAIIIILITISIPVGAKIFDIDVPENILKIYDEYFRLDVEDGNQDKDLGTLLIDNKLTKLVLPHFLFSDCSISDFEKYDEEQSTQVVFKYFDEEQKISGRVTINTYNEYTDFFIDDTLVNDKYEKAKKINVNGIDVFLFYENIEGLIVYTVEEIEYNIELQGVTFDKVIEIAETL